VPPAIEVIEESQHRGEFGKQARDVGAFAAFEHRHFPRQHPRCHGTEARCTQETRGGDRRAHPAVTPRRARPVQRSPDKGGH
jgi:hypothetical protein